MAKIRTTTDGHTLVYISKTGKWHSVRGVPKGTKWKGTKNKKK